MQMQKVFNLSKYVAMLLLMLHYVENVADHSPGNMTLLQAIDKQLERDDLHNHLLKRKRRYLEFPSGSSFQLVYDLIVGVVDYTNYLILGVTVALAWELPSKPPSEILSDLTERLKDGTLGNTRNDSIANIQYVDVKPSKGTTNNNNQKPLNHFSQLQQLFRPPMNLQYFVNRKPDQYYRRQSHHSAKPNRKSWRHKGNNWHSLKPKQPFATWTQNRRNFKATSSAVKYPWWNLKSRLPSYVKQRQPIQGSRRFDKHIPSLKRNRSYKATGRADHRIFPIFGKRSTSDSANRRKRNDAYSKWDRIHIRHHRSTRYDLYERIETFLNGRGSNGHHCVLRALCETGQKKTEEQIPASFVGEIMRAIFTLPETTEEHNDLKRSIRKHQRYDDAHELTGNCAARYHLCKDSLWSSHFVM